MTNKVMQGFVESFEPVVPKNFNLLFVGQKTEYCVKVEDTSSSFPQPGMYVQIEVVDLNGHLILQQWQELPVTIRVTDSLIWRHTTDLSQRTGYVYTADTLQECLKKIDTKRFTLIDVEIANGIYLGRYLDTGGGFVPVPEPPHNPFVVATIIHCTTVEIAENLREFMTRQSEKQDVCGLADYLARQKITPQYVEIT